MKTILVIIAMITLCGCGAIDRAGAYLTGNASEECMNGVMYYQFTSGASVAYEKNGQLKTCD